MTIYYIRDYESNCLHIQGITAAFKQGFVKSNECLPNCIPAKSVTCLRPRGFRWTKSASIAHLWTGDWGHSHSETWVKKNQSYRPEMGGSPWCHDGTKSRRWHGWLSRSSAGLNISCLQYITPTSKVAVRMTACYPQRGDCLRAPEILTLLIDSFCKARQWRRWKAKIWHEKHRRAKWYIYGSESQSSTAHIGYAIPFSHLDLWHEYFRSDGVFNVPQWRRGLASVQWKSRIKEDSL